MIAILPAPGTKRSSEGDSASTDGEYIRDFLSARKFDSQNVRISSDRATQIQGKELRGKILFFIGYLLFGKSYPLHKVAVLQFNFVNGPEVNMMRIAATSTKFETQNKSVTFYTMRKR